LKHSKNLLLFDTQTQALKGGRQRCDDYFTDIGLDRPAPGTESSPRYVPVSSIELAAKRHLARQAK